MPDRGSTGKTRKPRSEAVLDRLTGLHPKLIDLSLGRIERLLAALGHPEARLPPCVHVAGTNGKGSVVAFMKAVCEAAGYTVHAYTSPHLVRFNERIALAGAPIGDGPLADILEECEAANRGAPITFFEITTAAGFLAFSRVPADIALIETGLGGRFDATNVIARPALTAITPVAMDHMHFLGDTLAEIAFEKAGILKPGVTCVVAPQADEAARVIEARAAAVGAPLLRCPDDWAVDSGAYRDRFGRLDLPRAGLAGAHQAGNAALAIAGLRALDCVTIDVAAVAAGVAGVRWPARLQRLRGGRLARLLPAGWELWLDGGHNPAAAEALAAVARGWGEAPLHLVVGMLGNRDPAAFLRPLAPHVAAVRTVAVPGGHGTSPAAGLAASASAAGLTASAAALGLAAEPAPDVAAAIAAIVAAADRPGRILVCGSLYLAGAVLREDGAGGEG